ncbi:bifunctional folylpolyglutamate synthase/dihydrofolate synthase [Salinibius halmophilus]|uniref:bifunctional folylpolyglutamate synthase/dihydrofolate synthase n=1 Tax=Salinibius halmophilus TaxID=1853216 RepID=UPI000E66099C|nr:folylpolyglutamate synthase/dihydrofolate synthase family protein [Salinibius halmophilus]
MTLADWLQRIEQYHPSEIELGLDRLRHVWQAMNCRVDATVVTVAGTNGKGSTCAYIDALLTEHGLYTGRYSSPHFHQFNERILIDGQPVDDATLVAAFEHVDRARGDIPLTYFEFTTLAAFYCYWQAEVEVWILEVGLGGRLDAVNLLDADVAVLTSVGLDHQDYLGDTLEAIGREKAGICRFARPFVIGLASPPESVLRVAEQTDAEVLLRDLHFGDTDSGVYVGEQTFTVPKLNLPRINVATAMQAAQRLVDLEPALVSKALAKAALIGRMQTISWQGQTVTLDVAHNPEAATNLAQQLAGSSFAVVFAGLVDKDLAGVVSALQPVADTWHLAGLDVPRGLSAQGLAERTGLAADLYATPQLALEGALRTGKNVLVCGSFFTVSAALSWLSNPTKD